MHQGPPLLSVQSHRSSPLRNPQKGRPATQCDGCRDLRRLKRLHVKCACEGRRDPESEIGPVQMQPPTSGNKFGRKIPLIPKLPNGVRDIENISAGDTRAVSTRASQSPSVSSSNGLSENLIDRIRPSRSCCSGKRATPLPLTDNTKGFTDDSGVSRIMSSSSSTPSSLGLVFSATSHTMSGSPGQQSSSQLPQGIDCLCGPGCLCLGCTKHQQNPDGDVIMASGDCPADCPSCVDNSCGSAWPGRSSHVGLVGTAIAPSIWFTQATASQNLSLELDAEGESDDEMDAEGSPDPEFCTLPEEPTQPPHTAFGITTYPQKPYSISLESKLPPKRVEELSRETKRSCCAGKRDAPKFDGRVSSNGQSSRGTRL